MQNKKIKNTFNIYLFAGLVFAALLVISSLPPKTYALVRPIVFPVLGDARFVNDFYAPRSGGRVHSATDVMASQMQALVAVTDGTISFVGYPQPSWGYAIEITDSDDYTYIYLHMNNDTPGTEDNRSDPMFAYAPDMKVGNKVKKGQLIGFVGDSGKSNGVDHLHFEIIAPDGSPVNPYDSLRQAQIIPSALPYPAMPNELLPYGTDFKGGAKVAMGNFDADPESEFVTAAGRGGGPHVRVFDDDNSYLTTGFLAYNPDMYRGIDVAIGDVDGDGINEIITAPGAGAGPHIKVFNLNGTLKGQFFAYDNLFFGGVNVAAGDIDGDGTDEIITGAGFGGGPHVRAFNLAGVKVAGLFAYDKDFRGGVDVASGDVTGDTKDEIITSAGPSGGPHVMVFGGDGTPLSGFFAYEQSFRGGVRVSVGDVDPSSPEDEILTIPASIGGPEMKMFDANANLLDVGMLIESWWSGSYDIAAGDGFSIGSTGVNRRTSIRNALN